MLKRTHFIICILLISVFLLAGCSPENGNNTQVSLGQEFNLPVGQTVDVKGENLTIKFVSVTNDSRCPSGAQCIWAGEAKCQMSINDHGSVSEVILTVSGGSDAIDQEFYKSYKASFKLVPYPEVGKQISSTDYQLIMTLTK
jgi:hypothetical protein